MTQEEFTTGIREGRLDAWRLFFKQLEDKTHNSIVEAFAPKHDIIIVREPLRRTRRE